MVKLNVKANRPQYCTKIVALYTYMSLYVLLCPSTKTSGASHLTKESLLSPLSMLCAPILNTLTSILVPTSTLRAHKAPCDTYNIVG